MGKIRSLRVKSYGSNNNHHNLKALTKVGEVHRYTFCDDARVCVCVSESQRTGIFFQAARCVTLEWDFQVPYVDRCTPPSLKKKSYADK